MNKLVGSISLLGLLLSQTNSVGAQQGPVTITRARGDAVAVWDATADLAALIQQHKSKATILRTLESDAMSILAVRASRLQGRAKTLTVHVIYQQTGAVSAKYQTATLEGVEQLLTVRAATKAAAANGKVLSTQLAIGRTPPGVVVQVAGELPPEVK